MSRREEKDQLRHVIAMPFFFVLDDPNHSGVDQELAGQAIDWV